MRESACAFALCGVRIHSERACVRRARTCVCETSAYIPTCMCETSAYMRACCLCLRTWSHVTPMLISTEKRAERSRRQTSWCQPACARQTGTNHTEKNQHNRFKASGTRISMQQASSMFRVTKSLIASWPRHLQRFSSTSRLSRSRPSGSELCACFNKCSAALQLVLCLSLKGLGPTPTSYLLARTLSLSLVSLA